MIFMVPQLLGSFTQISIGLYRMSRLELWMCNSCGCPVCTTIPKQIKNSFWTMKWLLWLRSAGDKLFQTFRVTEVSCSMFLCIVFCLHRHTISITKYEQACFGYKFARSSFSPCYEGEWIYSWTRASQLQISSKNNTSMAINCYHLIACGKLNFSDAECWRCCWFPRWICYRCAPLVLYDLMLKDFR